jgi:FO synthase
MVPLTPSGVIRALARARRGVGLTPDEATSLLAARGDALEELFDIASGLRDRGLADAGRPGIITYSPKVFIPVTRLCRDRCHYCTFATVPHRVPSAYLSPDEVLDIARAGAQLGCAEALFTLGDRPEERWPAARQWLDEAGYADTLSYVRALSILVLEETGLLPHLNPGVMTWEEMRRLRPVAPSMGMMLETTAERLWSTPGAPHFGSPDKEPRVRLQVIEDAGRLSIPFTTGILVGIGETPAERIDALFALRSAHRRHRHIQEVIVQNFRAKDDTAMRDQPDLDTTDYLATLATARVLLGPHVRLQAPPNLSDDVAALLRAGVDDWGGVSPLTPDHVNPERPWPRVEDLSAATAAAGFMLRARLTAHPYYVLQPEWIDPRVRPHVDALADPAGLLMPGIRPRGAPWQEADEALGSYAAFAERSAGGRTDLNVDIDVTGRRSDRRDDFADVYGDWDEVRDRALQPASSVAFLDSDVRHALALAEEEPSALARPEHAGAALALMTATGTALDALTRLADDVRRDVVGDEVTYVVNRNINFTNVCYTGCRFCAFAQREADVDAFTLSLGDVAERVREAVAAGATEICMQGGIHPDLPGSAYFDLARTVKQAAPDIHLHAFSPMEVVNGASRSDMSVREWLEAAREAGVDSLPGTAAEILDDDVRWILTKGKLPSSTWIDVVTTAHEVGLPTTSTMMYGHVDHPGHWVDHLRVLRDIQERTGGFTEFVPLPFVHHNAPLYLAGAARPGPTGRDNRAVHAMARLMLHGAVDHVQCSWVKLGDDGCRAVLAGGVDDLGGTLMEETISRMAGSEHGSAKTVEALQELIRSTGRSPRERTTTYGVAKSSTSRLEEAPSGPLGGTPEERVPLRA